jgi:hypothetical protein
MIEVRLEHAGCMGACGWFTLEVTSTANVCILKLYDHVEMGTCGGAVLP